VAQSKRDDFLTCVAPCPVGTKTVTIPEIINQIHEVILEGHRTSAKSIAEQLGISRERVASIVHEDFNMRMFSAKWVQKLLNVDLKRQREQ
jgi:plasmid maintenance system antidote protein VapI